MVLKWLVAKPLTCRDHPIYDTNPNHALKIKGNPSKSTIHWHQLWSTQMGRNLLTPDLTVPFFPPKILSLGLWRWCGDVVPKARNLPRRQAWWKNGSGTNRAVNRHKTLVASCIMNEILLKGIVIINHYKDPYPCLDPWDFSIFHLPKLAWFSW